MDATSIAELVGATIAFVAFWMRLEHRLTKVETQIKDVKDNCVICLGKFRR